MRWSPPFTFGVVLVWAESSFFTAIEREICAGDLENRQPVKVPVKFRRNLLLGRSTWSDLFGVGDDDDLTDEGVFHGGVEEKVGDVCARG
jgi:hypothetical protein